MLRSIIRYLFVAILVCALQSNQGFVIPQEDAELDPLPSEEEPLSGDVNRSIMASLSAQQLAEDDALLKTIVRDATTRDDDLATETEAMFLSTVLHLLGQGEMYRDARIDAITAALRSAFLATTGRVDQEYIEKVLKAIREKDEQNRRLDDEHQTNVLRFVHSDEDDQELLNVSLPSALGGVAEKD